MGHKLEKKEGFKTYYYKVIKSQMMKIDENKFKQMKNSLKLTIYVFCDPLF